MRERDEEEDGGGWIDRAWWCEVTRSMRERDEEDTHTKLRERERERRR